MLASNKYHHLDIFCVFVKNKQKMQLKKAIKRALQSIAVSTNSGRPSQEDFQSFSLQLGAFFESVYLRREALLRNEGVEDQDFPGAYHAHLLSLDAVDMQLVKQVALLELSRRLGALGYVGVTTSRVRDALEDGSIGFEVFLGKKGTSLNSPLESNVGRSSLSHTGIYGKRLQELEPRICNADSRLPRVIVQLMAVIWERQAESRQLFRVEGYQEEVAELVEKTCSGFESDPKIWRKAGIDELTSLFKRYLRSIEGLVVPRTCCDALYAMRHIHGASRDRVFLSRLILLTLPAENLRALSSIILFLGSLSHQHSPTSMALVLSPSLFDSRADLQQSSWMAGLLGDLISEGFGEIPVEMMENCLRWWEISRQSIVN